MSPPDQETAQIADKLLRYLRDKLNDQGVEYVSPLTQLQGGFETATYRFQLKSVQQEMSGPLVLRLYPPYRNGEDAVWEGSIQNALSSQRYPVAAVHAICEDKSPLGGVFMIMDFLAGQSMLTTDIETLPVLLAETHAALHRLDPQAIIGSLRDKGIGESSYGIDRHFSFLENSVKELPWISDGVKWLMENRPPEPQRPALCHGDFHPMNILIEDGRVTAVLDWPGFLIADPALDVAQTDWLISVVYKLLLSAFPLEELPSELDVDFSSVDMEVFSQHYLDAYRALLPLDSTHMDYYKVKRTIQALIEGERGQEVWRHPLIEKGLIEFIHDVTAIQITTPH